MKKLLISVIIVLMLSTVTALADEAFNKKEAIERTDFVFIVDNEIKQLKNSAVTIEGVTYIAIREVSEMLGNDVAYDKGVITITSDNDKAIEEVEKKETVEENIIPDLPERLVIPQETKEEKKARLEFSLESTIATIHHYERRKQDLIKSKEFDLIAEFDNNIAYYTKEKEDIQQQLNELE